MKKLLALLLLSAVAGCVTPPPVSAPDGAALESGVLSRTGRFAVRVDELGGQQNAVQGGFAWRDAGRTLTLDLNSPLGAALARVQVRPDGSALLTEANGTRTEAADADELVARVLGSAIPVAGLRYWLRGELARQMPAEIFERDARGRAQAFAQGGWRVRITEFDAIGPVRMNLQRAEPGNRNIDVRLVITPVPAP